MSTRSPVVLPPGVKLASSLGRPYAPPVRLIGDLDTAPVAKPATGLRSLGAALSRLVRSI